MSSLFAADIVQRAKAMAQEIAALDERDRIAVLNDVRAALHAVSPFADEPVDCVRWVLADRVVGNPYNPNTVAPPEMRLLVTSILADGYTQPIVANAEGDTYVVIDGFHRHRVGKENNDVRQRVRGYLPVVQIRQQQATEENRMASTIRHNRARGRHGVDAMSSIVGDLAKKGWDDAKIGKELGMDPDEVLRLKQITGLAELFSNRDFSRAWEIDESQLARGSDENV